MKHIAILFVVFAAGCAHTSKTVEAFAEPFPMVEIPEVEESPSEDGWCQEAAPIGPGVGVACTGILVPPNKLDLLMREAELLFSAKRALEASYGGRQSDRQYAVDAIIASEEQLKVAKEMQPKMFAVGAGVGAGSAIALILAIVLIAR
jgi:hypothetical protein